MPYIKSCRMCDEKLAQPFFDLGSHPLANSLLAKPKDKEILYPLALVRCRRCALIQLTYTVPPTKLFSHYVWVTGTSNAAREFSAHFYHELVARTANAKAGYVLEIASNDGTFLHPFKRAGYRVLGIDPAQNIVEIAKKNGIPTQCLYWGDESARWVRKKYGFARMIFARNVLAHVANTRDFVKGLATCLHEDGTLAIEVHYAGAILDGLQYDSIYHEHVCYFTFLSIERLLNIHGLWVFDIVESPISGGAIIVYAKKHTIKETTQVLRYRNEESRKKVNALVSWQNFAKRCATHKKKLRLVLNKILESGGTIGWGASARSSTLLNFCNVNSSHISLIADSNPLKHHLYTAGSHIQIVEPGIAMKIKPRYVVLLGWNFADEIMKILKKTYRYKGGYLIPFPNEPRLIKLSS